MGWQQPDNSAILDAGQAVDCLRCGRCCEARNGGQQKALMRMLLFASIVQMPRTVCSNCAAQSDCVKDAQQVGQQDALSSEMAVSAKARHAWQTMFA